MIIVGLFKDAPVVIEEGRDVGARDRGIVPAELVKFAIEERQFVIIPVGSAERGADWLPNEIVA